MPRAKNGSVELMYETFGDEHVETILLVNGLGSQMTRWTPPFCEILVARGHRVIRFDNRDTGLSSWPTSAYTVSDMAQDAVAVLDAAAVHKAHVVGLSMGGIVVQRMTIAHPERVLSMTSIMSTPGAGALVSTPGAHAALHTPPPDPATDLEGYLAHKVHADRTFGSPGYPTPDAELRERAITEYRRAYNPAGVARQLAAVRDDGDRTAALGRLKIPVVVVHGAEDPLVLPVGGEATAAAIPGAELRIIPGMGHDMPSALYDAFADAVTAASSRVSAPRAEA